MPSYISYDDSELSDSDRYDIDSVFDALPIRGDDLSSFYQNEMVGSARGRWLTSIDFDDIFSRKDKEIATQDILDACDAISLTENAQTVIDLIIDALN